MNTALKILFGIIGLSLFLYLSSTIISFLGIENTAYTMYIYWLAVLIIFWMILPSKVGNMFSTVI